MSHSTPSQLPTRRWFQPGDGIAREVITADIQRYLGPDALVKPGLGTDDYEGVDGYWITAYRTLTSQMVQDLKFNSQRWRTEAAQGRGCPQSNQSLENATRAYKVSSTYQSNMLPYESALEHQRPSPSNTQAYANAPPQEYRQPSGSAYASSDYTHSHPSPAYGQQNPPYVPAPGYGRGQVRTTPSYAYSSPDSDMMAPQGFHPHASVPPGTQYPPQPSTSPYYYPDGRSAPGHPLPQANDRRRRQ